MKLVNPTDGQLNSAFAEHVCGEVLPDNMSIMVLSRPLVRGDDGTLAFVPYAAVIALLRANGVEVEFNPAKMAG